jgi:hypothetical protein
MTYVIVRVALVVLHSYLAGTLLIRGVSAGMDGRLLIGGAASFVIALVLFSTLMREE